MVPWVILKKKFYSILVHTKRATIDTLKTYRLFTESIINMK